VWNNGTRLRLGMGGIEDYDDCMESDQDDLEEYPDNYNTDPICGSYHHTEMSNNGYVSWMSDQDVDGLVRRLKKIDYAENMVEDLRHALGTGTQMTAKQAKRIVKVFVHEHSKVEACKIIYYNLSDKQNVEVMLSALSFDVWREEVREALGI
jgi:hypothetical protein